MACVAALVDRRNEVRPLDSYSNDLNSTYRTYTPGVLAVIVCKFARTEQAG